MVSAVSLCCKLAMSSSWLRQGILQSSWHAWFRNLGSLRTSFCLVYENDLLAAKVALRTVTRWATLSVLCVPEADPCNVSLCAGEGC